MDERGREYAKMLLDRAAGGRPAGRKSTRPWVLPIVVDNGSVRWTAAGRGTDLAALPSAKTMRDLALFQPQAYHLLTAGGGLTAGAQPAQDWPLENRVSATVRLQAAATPQDLPPRLLEEFARFSGAGHEAFRRALHAWARALWEDKTGDAADFPAFEELDRTKGAIMTTVAEAAWDRWEAKVMAKGVERGVQRGIAQGRAEGGIHFACRQAALKFGTGAAERLAGLLEGLTEQEDLDRVGDWILQCDDGDELLSRVSSLPTNGRE